MRILVVDDQPSARYVIGDILSALGGVEVLEAGNLDEARKLLETLVVDLALLDVRLSDRVNDRGGLELLGWMRDTGRSTPAVMITASTEMGSIREAMRLGAQDYVPKEELSPEMLLPIVQGLRERTELRGQVLKLRERVDRRWGVRAIVGSSGAMERVRLLASRVADADCTVLIRGETGTGKELVAQALHEASSRADRSFLAINCATLPGTLIESLIFGHERGAFTGAVRKVRGQLELAGDGTVLLDEIAEMPIDLQAKLLRVLEDKRFRPLGAENELPLKARVLASTHVAIEQRISERTFREDLYYRLNVVAIDLPSLAERTEDIPELLHSFASDLSRKIRFDEQAMRWLMARRWPGNVRELKNAVARLALLSDRDQIDVPTLEQLIPDDPARTAIEIEKMAHALLALSPRVGSKFDLIEHALLEHALESSRGNKSAAARQLGVDRKALERRLERASDASERSAPADAPERDAEGET